MNSQHLANIFYGMVLSILVIWSHGTLAEDSDDYISTFDTPRHGNESSYFFNKPVPYIPRSDQALYTGRSFSDLTNSNGGIPSVIDRTAFTIDVDISNSPSSSKQRTPESQTSFREIQNALPTFSTLDRRNGRLKSLIYARSVSSASEDETWLMVLVGITLIGLQVFRSNKKAEPIYSSSN